MIDPRNTPFAFSRGEIFPPHFSRYALSLVEQRTQADLLTNLHEDCIFVLLLYLWHFETSRIERKLSLDKMEFQAIVNNHIYNWE